MEKKVEQMDISSKNTKEQILAAYNQAVSQLNSKDEVTNVTPIKKQQESTMNEATKIASKSIVEELSQFKIKMGKEIESLSDSLSKELQMLATVRDAVTLEKQTLEDLYKITHQAKALEALIKANRDEREIFETNKDQQEQEWQKKISQLEIDYKEKRELLEKNKKREEDEYNYKIDIDRRKERDIYLMKKAQLEKELTEQKESLDKRENVIVQKEQLLLELQTKVENFDQELVKRIEQAETILKEKLEKEHYFSKELAQREADSLLKMQEQKNGYLESKIKEQEAFIKQLMHKSEEAAAHVQAIACRALDTSSQRFMSNGNSRDDV